MQRGKPSVRMGGSDAPHNEGTGMAACWAPQTKFKTLPAGTSRSPSLSSLFHGSAASQPPFLHYLCFGERVTSLDCTKMLWLSAPWLLPFLRAWRGLPSLEVKLSMVSISHVSTPRATVQNSHDENSAHILVHHLPLIANNNIHLHLGICLKNFTVPKVKVYILIVSTLQKEVALKLLF